MLKKRTDLFGLFIDDVSMEQAIEIASEGFLKSVNQTVFFTPNLEILDGARRSAAMRNMLNSATISLPDGFALRIVSYLLGNPLKNTVSGIDFGENILKLAAKTGKRVFLLGGKDGVAEKSAKMLCKKYEGLNICGTHHGYFGNDEFECVCEAINQSGAEILFVCRGFPRQEKFVFVAKDKLPTVKIFACLGGSLDVWAGNVKRAPLLIQRAHLEWLWRIILEPERAERFFFSLPTLFSAFSIFLSENRIIPKRKAYIQIDTLGR